MKKKRGKKSNRGRKPKRAVLSGIKSDQETWDEIRCRIILGSPEWAMVALRQSIKNASELKGNPFWNRLCVEFERAVINGDSDWFRRQAKAIEKGGSPRDKRVQFDLKVISLLEQAQGDTLWRQIQADFKAGKVLKKWDLSLTPARKVTDATARKIYDTLEKHELPNGLLEVEGWRFENKERVMDAIRELATRLQFALKKQLRKR